MTFVNLNQNLHIDFSYIKKLNSMFMVVTYHKMTMYVRKFVYSNNKRI